MKCRYIDGSKESLKKVSEALGMRGKMSLEPIIKTVQDIIEQVRTRGDEAVLEYTSRFDGADLSENLFRVTEEEMRVGLSQVDEKLIRIMQKAADNIRIFHDKQKEEGYRISVGEQAEVGMLVRPLSVVGVYVPAGTAPLPSTVLMDTIPAKVAGVPRVILCSPPRKDGTLDPTILAAAKLAGVDEIYKIGGAQAIAAMAYGTATVPRVDKVCGPGNIYVNTAKRLLFGQIDIDMFAGPSEILIIADDSARPEFVAADMLSQAEHDKLASAVLLTTSATLADAVMEAVDRRSEKSPRKSILSESLKNYCAIVTVPTLEDALAFSEEIAPEHLELCISNPDVWISKVKNAGAIFVGNFTPESVGDYFAGPNHTLPTSGTARFFSPLNVGDFTKKISLIRYDEATLKSCYEDIAYFARAEGLEAHAQAVTVRFE